MKEEKSEDPISTMRRSRDYMKRLARAEHPGGLWGHHSRWATALTMAIVTANSVLEKDRPASPKQIDYQI